jgi:hypothetical protein
MEEQVPKYTMESLYRPKTKEKKLTKNEAENICLTNHQLQILYGTLLGDGSLKSQKNFANIRFQMRHSAVQQAWFLWKANQLASLATNNAIHVQQPDGLSSQNKLHFQTRALPALTKLHDEIYKNNFIHLRMEWLNKLDPVALMVWWLDDGSRIGSQGGKGRLATHCFSYTENLLLKIYFQRKWNISPIICKIQKPTKNKATTLELRKQKRKIQKAPCYYVLEFSNTNFKKLCQIIMPHVPVKEMVYKFFIKYKKKYDFDCWIHQLKSSMPQFLYEIEQFEKQFGEMI